MQLMVTTMAGTSLLTQDVEWVTQSITRCQGIRHQCQQRSCLPAGLIQWGGPTQKIPHLHTMGVTTQLLVTLRRGA